MSWTQFWDMHSGGGCKQEPYEKIYIEAPEEKAKLIFYNRFGHNPDRVTCTCCGEDYSVREYPSIEEATSYHRGESQFRPGPTLTVEEYEAKSDVLFIRAGEIKSDELEGTAPTEGYVWTGGE